MSENEPQEGQKRPRTKNVKLRVVVPLPPETWELSADDVQRLLADAARRAIADGVFRIPVAEGTDVLIDATEEEFAASVEDALTRCREEGAP